MIFGVLAGVLLAGVGVLGLTTVAAVVGGVLVVADAGLMWLRRRALDAAGRAGVVRSTSGGRQVAVVIALLAALAILPSVLIRVADLPLVLDSRLRLWPLRGLVLSAAGVAAVVHFSALIDWACIRLRLLGVLGARSLPCQRDASTNWSLLTRLWLGHRVIAFVVGRLGLAAMIGFTAALLISTGGEAAPAADAVKDRATTQPVPTIIGAAVAAVLVFFINRFLPVWSLVMNPRLSVGDRIVLAEEYGTGVTVRPQYYVVDVAVEGVKLLQLDEGGQPKGAAGRDPEREHDRSLNLVDVPRLLRFRGRFSGCADICCGANHNCPIGFGNPVVTPPAQVDERDDGAATG